VREQAVVHKVGNRSGIAGQRRSGGTQQKAQRRGNSGEGAGARLRAIFNYFPSVLKVVLALVVGVVIFASYRAAASATFFQVRTVEVQGTARVSSNEIQTLVRQQIDKNGVWNADLKAISARIERLSWVRQAVVSRVLPDGIRVRISEREPKLVVRTAGGRFRWVDEEAVMLGDMLPTDQIPSFFLRGLNEEDSETARTENRERVQKFLELQKDWEAVGLSERVSEVNLMDIRDVRAQLAGDSSQIEVRLGSQDQGKRLKYALNVLDEQRQTPRGALISYIDMNQGTRAIVGLTSGNRTGDPSDNLSGDNTDPAGNPGPPTTPNVPVSTQPRTTDPKVKKETKPTSTDKKSDKTKETARRRA
jgi:cell division septal protein FtsQ